MRGRGEGRDALRSGFPAKVLAEPGAPSRRDSLVLVCSCSALPLPATEAQRSLTPLNLGTTGAWWGPTQNSSHHKLENGQFSS